VYEVDAGNGQYVSILDVQAIRHVGGLLLCVETFNTISHDVRKRDNSRRRGIRLFRLETILIVPLVNAWS